MNKFFTTKPIHAFHLEFIPALASDVRCAVDKLLHTATVLPEGNYLGIQLTKSSDGALNTTVFGDMDADVEDYAWLVQGVANIDTNVPELSNSFQNSETLLALTQNTSAVLNGSAQNAAHSLSKDDRDNFLDLLQKSEASMIFLAFPGKEQGATINAFISAHQRISLRVRAQIGLLFPDVKMVEISSKGDTSVPDLPIASAKGMISALIQSLTERAAPHLDVLPQPADSLKSDDDLIDAGFEDGAEDDILFTPIEELDLSVRAFNCLKRRGIDTLEQLMSLDDEDLKRTRNLGVYGYEEVKRKLEQIKIEKTCVTPKETDCAAALDNLIGLEEVKSQVKKITALARMQKDAKQKGLNMPSVTLNMEFSGNPGTAKTTVARYIAGILHKIGLLHSSEMIEVGRADLIADYVGQTAGKVKNVFERANGKVLFIDEAYSLVDDRKGSYGDEAINTIVQEMENHRDTTVVIFAGYPAEMENFFARNPGLRSRVPFQISFPDYSADELVKITGLEVTKRGFAVTPETEEKIATICERALEMSNSGNGRFCRNLVDDAILSYAERVYGGDDVKDVEQPFTLVPEDFNAADIPSKQIRPIGFCVSA